MSASGGNSDFLRSPAGSTIGGNGSGSSSRRYGLPFSTSNLIQAPLSALLEYSGILRPRSSHLESENLIGRGIIAGTGERGTAQVDESFVTDSSGGEVSIRIFDIGDQENPRASTGIPQSLPVGLIREGSVGDTDVSVDRMHTVLERQREEGTSSDAGVGFSSFAGATPSPSVSGFGGQSVEGEGNVAGVNSRDSPYQRYDIQQAARWIEQVLPFSLLLLVVFIRQHLQGFFITIWLSAVMFKSNDLLRKQTALKGERKISVLVGIAVIFTFHVVGVYWWHSNDGLLYPLVMLPPKEVPLFWHAIFIIMVNDTMVRQAAMAVKCVLLVYYKNSRGCYYRKQGQLLTIVEYLVLLYRALLPTPVWYRFFLNKEYGSLFSSLTTGLYLTFKLTSVVEKVQSFMAAVKALSRKEMHYGSNATVEQVIAAGDLCAICQEKMHAPILLRCKHVFCEDCVSEWFERERTCPLCRALVKPADLRSFSDGSTSLFFQIF
ncbi:RING finger and transmembrane domain-containing protein 2 [Dendrobium catenatum]|uniref:RING-H2 finger protein ATL40 n=1 Tax=Dendrobium catenatum TaxID=906689 RepID=A0A2I0VP19_9ASPA|nr:RING finger and transmembrane domain-containing protein 2 [Dendrobium catenatum]PKU65154.1 RING-H2 finger protein ATL40 [Dendrobium catenatum]